ncbi:MAG: hypothetical protein ACRDI2_04700 [Chloroflexota bacterium]
MLARAFSGRFALLAGLALLTGVLPAGFAVLVARLVEAVPGAVAGGFASAAGRNIAGLLAGIAGVLVAREVVRAAYEVGR